MTALDHSARGVAELVGQVDESQWALPTPCTEWDVRELVGHLIAGGRAYADLLHGAPAAHLQSLVAEQATLGGDDPTEALAEAAAAVRTAFAEPGAFERTVHHPVGDVPDARPRSDARHVGVSSLRRLATAPSASSVASAARMRPDATRARDDGPAAAGQTEVELGRLMNSGWSRRRSQLPSG